MWTICDVLFSNCGDLALNGLAQLQRAGTDARVQTHSHCNGPHAQPVRVECAPHTLYMDALLALGAQAGATTA